MFNVFFPSKSGVGSYYLYGQSFLTRLVGKMHGIKLFIDCRNIAKILSNLCMYSKSYPAHPVFICRPSKLGHRERGAAEEKGGRRRAAKRADKFCREREREQTSNQRIVKPVKISFFQRASSSSSPSHSSMPLHNLTTKQC